MAKTVAVIDGNSLMHRAYHAIQTPMMALDGTPTNAVFGFLQMFCKFVEEMHPDAVVCAFDEGKPEFRMQEMPGYKAQRPHMDDELRVQFPIIKELLSALRVPVLTCPGWEGDDILGTIAKRDESLGFETYLVTGDKDACQLASDLTKIVSTKKGISDVQVLGPAEVMEKYGVTPAQFIDYLGLMGDSSDNIPGVPGIGPKSATSLLERFSSIEGIFEHIDELKGKQKENLIANEGMAYLSRQIATIVCDLDLEVDLEGISFPDFDQVEVEEHFKKYSLASPLTRVLNLIDAQASTAFVPIEIGAVLEPDRSKELLESAMKRGERIGVAHFRPAQDSIFQDGLTCAVSTSEGTCLLEGEKARAMLLEIMLSSSFAALDLKELIQVVYPPDTSEAAIIKGDDLYMLDGFDIALAAYILDSSRSSYAYESLCERYLGNTLPEVKDEEEELIIFAVAARKLSSVLAERLEQACATQVMDEIDLPLVPVLAQMERTGVSLNTEHLSELGAYANSEIEALAARIYRIAGEEFNIDSPKQLGRILFDVLELPPIKKNSRGYSTDATVMKELAKTHEIAGLVLSYRELSKIRSTYIDSLPKMRAGDGRLHTVFHETVTATGRLSSSDPNLQNIPVRTEFGRKIRECFIPLDESSVFMSCDYSQIELRLLAHLSEDEHLIAAFNSGADFHAQTAARVFGVAPDDVTPELRSRAKAVNFGIVYGQQAFGLAQTLDIPRSEAKEMIDRYFDAYPGVRSYLDEVVAKAADLGFATTMFGRIRPIPELKSSSRQTRGFGERTAMNHPMQGSAADIIKLAMIRVMDELRHRGSRARLLLQVHDELDFSVPKDEVEEVSALVVNIMEHVVELKVPLLVDASWGRSWAEAH